MSSINDQVGYTFSVDVSDKGGDGDSGGSFTLQAAAGITDDIALAIYEALKNVPWSASTTARVSVVKVEDVQTTYEPDLTQNPPVFT